MKSGNIIDNAWEIIESGEHGGQAQIYKVRPLNNTTSDYLALKFLHKQNDPDRRKRMYFEVENLKKLHDDHILNIVATNAEKYESSEKLYYVCPFINGCTLEQFIFQESISFTQAISFFTNFINVISYCHENNVIHRDIKPDNIMISNNNLNDFTLIDFGLSFNIETPQEDITPTNQQLGNRFLLLPELVSGSASEKHLIQSDMGVAPASEKDLSSITNGIVIK